MKRSRAFCFQKGSFILSALGLCMVIVVVTVVSSTEVSGEKNEWAFTTKALILFLVVAAAIFGAFIVMNPRSIAIVAISDKGLVSRVFRRVLWSCTWSEVNEIVAGPGEWRSRTYTIRFTAENGGKRTEQIDITPISKKRFMQYCPMAIVPKNSVPPKPHVP